MTPSTSGLAASQESVFAGFLGRVSITDTVVAEIGGAFPVAMLEERRVARWYCIDPSPPDGARSGPQEGGVREVIRARAEAIPLPDQSVDAIFSSNAFQFLDVAATLAEARRILRPGGVLYSHFGPIWSAPDGHQLEYVSFEGRPLAFWSDTLLPPWAHLAYEREQLRGLLRSGLPGDLADLLVWHIHDSTTINRLFFEDYVDAVLRSGLQWETMSASDHLDYEIELPSSYEPSLLLDVDERQLAATISARRGSPVQLGARDVLMVLRRSPELDPLAPQRVGDRKCS